jgi:hypothetical protein
VTPAPSASASASAAPPAAPPPSGATASAPMPFRGVPPLRLQIPPQPPNP